jgi:RNA polymerase sigma factor (TIGR02999 family)
MSTMNTATEQVSGWVLEASDGPAAANDLFPQVYDVLQRTAHQRMARERAGHTFSTGDLVHEAYLKLVRLDRIQWQGRSHFLAMAAQAMRNILVDHALKRGADKRGGGAQRVELDEELAGTIAASELLTLHEALRRLEAVDGRQCRVVECRLFAGMSVEETAEALEISPASVKRDWTLARAWLNRELGT